ncbi:MAG: RidA family protein [Steroidobacteraceae bacterium]
MYFTLRRSFAFLAAACAMLSAHSAHPADLEIKRWNPEGLAQPTAYSQVVTVEGSGKTIYLGGKAGVRPDNTFPKTLEEQVELIFDHVGIALAAAGATPADVVEIQIFIVDLADIDPSPIYKAVNKFFPVGHKPASMVIGVEALAYTGLLVEINVKAIVPSLKTNSPVAHAAELEIKRWNPEGLAQPTGYSQVVTVEGDRRTIYLGGITGIHADSTFPPTIEEQRKQLNINVQKALEAAGATLDDVVERKIFMVGLAKNPFVPPVAAKPGDQRMQKNAASVPAERKSPVAMVIGVPALARPGILIEVNLTAVVPTTRTANR